MDSTDESWELIMVNDGSKDGSLDLMLGLSEQDERVKVINFARNFGHQVAVTAGIDYATGKAVVLIDADLQDPPAVILDLIAKWKEGYDVVYAVRSERRGESAFKKLTAKLYSIVPFIESQILTFQWIQVIFGSWIRRSPVCSTSDARTSPFYSRYDKLGRISSRQVLNMSVKNASGGETKYPFRKMVAFALDAVTSFSFFPLQVMIYISFTSGICYHCWHCGSCHFCVAYHVQGDEFLWWAGNDDYVIATHVKFIPIVFSVYHRTICGTNLR